MESGQNGPDVQAETGSLTQSSAPSTAPTQQGLWTAPPETADMLRSLNGQCQTLLQKIGALEVDYLTAKNATLDELKNKRLLFKNVIDEAARNAGLDIDKSPWNLDLRTMTLVRAS